ncbi:hypothetical protein C9374_003607 [Naegleria lovaniensis]|uniref:Histone H2B n=1 Tax=Naegleria lovaniensis TaxID=51637 RepID=A0AA88GZE8_NAELO|nr:uncharacterized protein C9374_003607 [Naegleria lovaniensis]KAG2393843.1 hypothetical protein C9374_003607 [Naegleria lovaniensis]
MAPSTKKTEKHHKQQETKKIKISKATKTDIAEDEADSDKKKKKSRHESYSSYIYRVLKQVHNELEISSKTMSIMNSFVQDVFERIVKEAVQLCRVNGNKTLSTREIQTAAKLILPGELAMNAVYEGTKAVIKYRQSFPRPLIKMKKNDELIVPPLGRNKRVKTNSFFF